MIYEFAVEPDLAASWHDPRVAYPFLSQMGAGQRRVACAFPADKWGSMVINALRGLIPPSDDIAWQNAKKRIEILLRHLQQMGTTRHGRIDIKEAWVDAATREHRAFPFGGILVRSSAIQASYLVAADELGVKEFIAWDPPNPPVPRSADELTKALAPLLRCATEIRFVDPHFDANVWEFLDPMRAFLQAAQNRRSAASLRLQLHLAVYPHEVIDERRVGNPSITEVTLAKQKCQACRQLSASLKERVALDVFVWAESHPGDKLHNRYVLSNLGGVAVPTGLDQSKPRLAHTDDLIVLSKEQHAHRWRQYAANSTLHRLLHSEAIPGSR